MSMYDYLPKYHQVEANNLKGLQPGFVVAQMELDPSATIDQAKFNLVGENMLSGSATKGKVANGHIVTISANGIKEVGTPADPLFLVYNEPLNTIVDSAKFYATDLEEENLRLVQLVPGDEWMSDLDVLNENYPGHEHLAGRVVEVTHESTMSKDDWFKMTTLADGTAAKHYMFIK